MEKENVQYFLEKSNLKNLDKDKIRMAYLLAEKKFKHKNRDSWEPYFEHLVRTAKIIINEFKKIDTDRIILALIHDIKEDTNIYDDTIEYMFWKNMLKRLKSISKNDEKLKQKTYEERKQKYFERLLKYEDRVVIDVKLADRIDNLRTMKWVFSKDKILKKIDETKKYLLPLAEKHNKKALKLIKEEIIKLEKYLSKIELTENLSSSKK